MKNNFGAYVGGPVVIPKLYNGHDKTFFFGSYEVLRRPRTETGILSVPTQAMRNDGRFLIPVPVQQSGSVRMTVVINWTEGLKR